MIIFNLPLIRLVYAIAAYRESLEEPDRVQYMGIDLFSSMDLPCSTGFLFFLGIVMANYCRKDSN